MRIFIHGLGAILAWVMCVAMSVACANAATLPVTEGFENYADGTPLTNLSATGWGASSPSVVIRTLTDVADVVRGTNGVSVPGGTVSSNLLTAVTFSNVWVDLYVNTSMGVSAALATSQYVDTNLAVETFLDTNGCPVVWNSVSNAWVTYAQDYWQTNTTTFTSQWERLTLCQNYSNKTVAVFMNQHLLIAGLPFINTNLTSYQRFEADGGMSGSLYFDQVSISYTAPTNWTADLDNDGMSDAQEIQLYGNLTGRHRPIITLVAPTNGTVTPVGPFDVIPGGQTNFLITASNGYYVADVRTNGQSVGSFTGQYTAGATYTWTNISPDGLSDGVFAAVFVRKPQLTPASSGSGTITISTNEVFPGGQVNVAMTAGVAWAVTSVLTNSGTAATFTGQQRTGSYTFSNIWTDTTVTAVFTHTGLRFVPSDYPTIQAAVSAAQAGDTIVVSSGFYTNAVTFGLNLTVLATNTTILGGLTVSGGATGTLAGCQGLTITGGVTVASNGLLVVNGGSNDIGTLTVQSGGTVQVSNVTAFVADGATFTGTVTFTYGWETTVVPQVPPYADPFERYAIGTKMNRMGYFGWAASSDSVVAQTNQAQNNVAVAVSAQSVLSGTMAASASSNVWLEFYYQDTNRISVETADNRQDNSVAVELFVNTNGYVTVFNPDLGGWDVCSNDAQGVAVSNLANNAWMQIAVNQNYKRGRAALFLDGRLLRQQLRFINTNLLNSGRFELDAGSVGPAYVDTYSVWTNGAGVVSLDLDNDGIPDALEIDQKGFIYDSPLLMAPTVSSISTNGATLACVVTNGGGRLVTSWGTVWDAVVNPTGNVVTIMGSTNAPFSFTTNVVGFSPGQHYYCRGWASNSVGLAYSTNSEFYAEPVQASGVVVSSLSTGSVSVSWTADASSTGTVVLIRQGGAVDAAPVDGSNYTANASFSGGSVLGTSNYVVYAGSGTNVIVNNLIPGGAIYQVAAFAYAGGGSLIQYRTNNPPTASQRTFYVPPVVVTPTVADVGMTTATLGASVTNGGGGPITSWGVVWDTAVNPTGNVVTILGSTNAPFSFTTNVAGFSPGQHYYYRGWASNSDAFAYSANGEFYAEPLQAVNLTDANVANGAFMISWTAGVSSTGTVVLIRQGGAVDAAPVDGSNYTANASFGGGSVLGTSNYVVYAGSGTNVLVNSLVYGMPYQVTAFAYAGSDALVQFRTNNPPTCLLQWASKGSVYTIR